MEPLAPTALTYGWASGVNAYLTVALYGILGRAGVADAPEFVQRTEVIAVVLAMFAIEFVIDKLPIFDSLWDLPHWAIRPAIGSALGVAVAGDASTLDQALAGGASGATAIVSHGVKVAVRLGVNSSPEPFTNAIVSLAEDAAVGLVTYLVIDHPWLAFGLAVVLLTLGIVVAILLAKLVRAGYRRLRARLGRAGPAPPDVG